MRWGYLCSQADTLLSRRSGISRPTSMTTCSMLFLILGGLVALSQAETPKINQSARQVPVVAQVDVLIVGGSTGAVSAALAVAEQGTSAFPMDQK